MGANAQTAVPAFTAGQVLTAAQMTQVNTGIPVFASSTERDAAFGGTGEKTLAEGQYAFLEDTNQTLVYDGSSWAAVGIGKILQVVSTSKVDQFTTTASVFTDVTGLSATITPTSATSTILVVAAVSMGSAAGYSGYLNLVRDSTNIAQSTGAGTQNMTKLVVPASAAILYNPTVVFEDSPATTSATTYKIQIKSSTGGQLVSVNRRADSTAFGSTSSITVLELSA